MAAAEKRRCARHIHVNWSKNHGGKLLKKHFWTCATATTEAQFHLMCDLLETKKPGCVADLMDYPPMYWCKAYFNPDIKCDVVDNNLCEAFNGSLVDNSHGKNCRKEKAM